MIVRAPVLESVSPGADARRRNVDARRRSKHQAVSMTPTRTAGAGAHRHTTTIACVIFILLAGLLARAPAEAAPIKFEFETQTLAGDPFGEGFFIIDATQFPFPHKIVKFTNAFELVDDFFYSDPHAGVFHKHDLASIHFEIGIDPNTLEWSPATSLWAFVVANFDNSRSLIGGVSGLTPPVGTGNTESSNNDDKLPLTVFFPEQVPEPATLLLLATAIGGFVARRHLSRR
jgi:hypothetical protein